MVLCSRCERKKVYAYIYSQRIKTKNAVQKINKVFAIEKKVFTVQKRNMAFTMEMMFSAEDRSGGGRFQSRATYNKQGEHKVINIHHAEVVIYKIIGEPTTYLQYQRYNIEKCVICTIETTHTVGCQIYT